MSKSNLIAAGLAAVAAAAIITILATRGARRVVAPPALPLAQAATPEKNTNAPKPAWASENYKPLASQPPETGTENHNRFQALLQDYRNAAAAFSSLTPATDAAQVDELRRRMLAALEALRGFGPELVKYLLAEFERENNPGGRAQLMRLVIRYCDEGTLHTLQRRYLQFTATDRRAMVGALVQRDNPATAPFFQKYILHEKSTATKNVMLDYLLKKETAAQEMKPKLLNWFGATHDSEFKVLILKDMSRYSDDTDCRNLYEKTLAPDSNEPLRVKRSAMYSYAASHSPEAVATFARILDESNDYKTRASAIKALEFTHSEDALRMLDSLAHNDPDERIRKRAANSASIIRRPQRPETVDFDKNREKPQPQETSTPVRSH